MYVCISTGCHHQSIWSRVTLGSEVETGGNRMSASSGHMHTHTHTHTHTGRERARLECINTWRTKGRVLSILTKYFFATVGNCLPFKKAEPSVDKSECLICLYFNPLTRFYTANSYRQNFCLLSFHPPSAVHEEIAVMTHRPKVQIYAFPFQ